MEKHFDRSLPLITGAPREASSGKDKPMYYFAEGCKLAKEYGIVNGLAKAMIGTAIEKNNPDMDINQVIDLLNQAWDLVVADYEA